jgi:hypothetical protein
MRISLLALWISIGGCQASEPALAPPSAASDLARVAVAAAAGLPPARLAPADGHATPLVGADLAADNARPTAEDEAIGSCGGCGCWSP